MKKARFFSLHHNGSTRKSFAVQHDGYADGYYMYRWTTRDGKRHSVTASTLEELREKSNSSISNIASQATQTLMGSGMQLITTGMAMKQNKGIMTGACYIGDPENGGTQLIKEGEAKKLTWKLFN